MERLGKRYQSMMWFVVMMTPVLVCQFVYIFTATVNVPLMDYWRYINMFVEKMNTTGLTFGDIWKNDHIHRSPLQFIYFILNIRLFNYNVQIEEYLGIVMMTMTTILLYRGIKKDIPDQHPLFYGVAGTILALLVFNRNQWEMITEEFALSFASRQILFFMCFLLTSRYLNGARSWKTAVALLPLYMFTITFVGSGYFPAFVVTVAFTVVLNYTLRYKEEKNEYIWKYLLLLGGLSLGTALYMYGIETASYVAGREMGILSFIYEFMLGSAVMVGVSWFGFSFSEETMLAVGAIIILLYVVSLVVYFAKKYYKRTYAPILLYGYGAGTMGLIYIGRMGLYGLNYAYTSRYVCETNCLIIGFVWILYLILGDCLAESTKKKRGKNKNFICIVLVFVFLIAVLIPNFYSRIEEWKVAPYRKSYGNTIVEYIERLNELEPEEFSIFQAPEDEVCRAVETLKKYNLWIYTNEK